MNIASWFIKNNRTAAVALLLVALAGVRSFFTISRLEDPEFTIRVAVVSTWLPGASPQKIEELITDPIEKKIQEMPEVDHITSQSLNGMSLVMVEIQPKYSDMPPIWTRLRNKIEDIRHSLPEGVQGPVVNDEFGDVFPVVAAVTGDGFTYREIKDYAEDARDRLLRLDTVAKVQIYGAQAERIFIEFSNARLAELGLTPAQLGDILKAQNVLQPGGIALVDGERVTIEATGEFKSIRQIGQVSLRAPGRAETVCLRDIAEIRRDFVDPPTTLTRFNGAPCLMLAVSMTAGMKVTDLGREVQAALAQIQAAQPHGIDYHTFLYQPKYVDRAIGDLLGNLWEAFLYVVLVMLVFAGLRMGLIAGLLVPMAMLMCLALMPQFDIKLQSVSIASLIIALGMLVDNGIVTSENILVRLSNGEQRLSACAGAVRELWLPLLTSSLTTIVAFLPIAIADSDVGEFCRSIFQVVAITLLCSWLLSLTMIPLLCFYFLQPKQRVQRFDGFFYRNYRALLLWSLRRRVRLLLATGALLALALWAFRFVPAMFFPPNEREMALVDFWMPYGTDIRATRGRVAELENFLLRDTNVVSVGVFIGDGGPRWMLSLNIEQENPNYANLIVTTRDQRAVDPLIARVQAFLDQTIPECRHTVKKLETGPPVGAPVKIRIAGPDLDVIYRLRDQIAQTIAGVPGVINIRDDWGEWNKKMEIAVNQEQAKQAGFNSYDIAASLQAQISGLAATDFREGRELIPIEIRAQGAYREDLGRIESMRIYSYQNSGSAPLLQMARARFTWEPSNIRRRDKVRTMEIQTDVSGRFASEVLADVMPRVRALTAAADWPDGYDLEFGGENAESDKAQNSITAGLPLAVALLVLILIYQFNSIRRPLIIMLTVPPMLVGVVSGLLITNTPFGFMAFLGLISLMGVIVNNAIMMIDRMDIERAAGQTWQDAIVVSAQRRLRPILMTAITTIIGLLPLALKGGGLWRPMANTIMFGLAFATLLTLLLCPALCSLLFRAGFRDYRWDPAALDRSQAE